MYILIPAHTIITIITPTTMIVFSGVIKSSAVNIDIYISSSLFVQKPQAILKRHKYQQEHKIRMRLVILHSLAKSFEILLVEYLFY